MNGVEYRNLCDLAEHRAITEGDRVVVNRVLSWSRYSSLSDESIAEVAWIRACAARTGLRPRPRGGPPMWAA